MEYVEPNQARNLPGLRLALTAHMPAPYCMSARAVLDHHQVPFVAVKQVGAGANEDLVAWTRHRNAPVAVYENEAPRVGWLEILQLAERLGNGPSLLPADIHQRMQMIGLINELIGENGLVWNLRILMLGIAGPERAAQAATTNPMFSDYGYSEAAHAQATARAQTILQTFTEHARAQPGHYLIGDHYTALDIYWVFFSQLLNTLSEQDCPTPEGLKKTYDAIGQAVGGCDDDLIAKRDWILANHLAVPLTF